MGLFQRQPIANSSVPPYTTSANRTYLIVGLGNPGKKYIGTRHNVGFAAVEEFAKTNNFPSWISKKDLKAELTVHNLGENRVILAKPQTYMNLSGEAVQAVQHFYKLYNHQTLVVYDELAIPFGQLRTRLGGSDAGHNGVKSLITNIGEDFGRLRVGIGSDLAVKADAEKFVLSKFSSEEKSKLTLVLKEAGVLITEYVYSGQLPHDTRNVLQA